MANDSNEQLEVTVKFKMMPFPVTITVWSEAYLKLLKEFEFKGLDIEAILMQNIGVHEIWITNAKSLALDPRWITPQLTETTDEQDFSEV